MFYLTSTAIRSAILAVAILSTAPASAATSDAVSYVKSAAAKYDVPSEFALQVSHHETRTRCGLRGASGEVGPLQIMPATARGLGYAHIARSSCQTQADAGMKHLAQCYHGMGGNRWMAAACHNFGFRALTTTAARMPRSVKAYANAVMGNARAMTASIKASTGKFTITPAADKITTYKTNFTSAQ